MAAFPVWAAEDSTIHTPTINDIYVVAYNAPTFIKLYDAPKWTYCSCVEFAKWTLGRQGESWGAAWNIEPRAVDPYVGGLILTYEGKGHIGVITDLDENGIYFIDANYEKCQKTTRFLPYDSKYIRGYR